MILREANSENERFYGVPEVSPKEALSGQAVSTSGASHQLYCTMRAIEKQTPSLSGLPKPGKCTGDCRTKAPTTAQS